MSNKPAYYIIKLLGAVSNNKSNLKPIIREAALDGCTELFLGFQLLFNKGIIFNIGNIPLIKGNFTISELEEDTNEFNWDSFILLTAKLLDLSLSKEKVKELLYNAATVSCINDWNYFYRIILSKHIDNNITALLINEILYEIGNDALLYLIPIWKIKKPVRSKIKPQGKKYIEPKLIGTRIITIFNVKLNTVTMYDYYGNIYNNATIIVKYLYKLLCKLPESFVLDGIITTDNKYILFDALFYNDFKINNTMILTDRHDMLIELIPYIQKISNGNICVLPKKICNIDNSSEYNELSEFYNEMIEEGYTNIIIKDMNDLYNIADQPWIIWP